MLCERFLFVTLWEVKLASSMCELTIYDYLQKQFGGVLIGNHNNFEDDEEQILTKAYSEVIEKSKSIQERLEKK